MSPFSGSNASMKLHPSNDDRRHREISKFHIIFTVHSVLYNSFYFNQHMHICRGIYDDKIIVHVLVKIKAQGEFYLHFTMFYPLGKSPKYIYIYIYILHRRLDGIQNRSGHDAKEKNCYLCRKSCPEVFRCITVFTLISANIGQIRVEVSS
jgi:hypothetical protein